MLDIADQLREYLLIAEVAAQIIDANQPGRSSVAVQNVFLEHARGLGFRDESKGLFKEYPSSALRPDYFMPLGETGIILEVERGKTTINNMDLLDFWKCHICAHADYLFLMVPQELRQNDVVAAPRREFAASRSGCRPSSRRGTTRTCAVSVSSATEAGSVARVAAGDRTLPMFAAVTLPGCSLVLPAAR